MNTTSSSQKQTVSRHAAQLAGLVIALAGLAGFLFAVKDGFVNPEMMSWHLSGSVLIMIILGGLGHLRGALIGAFAFALLQELFKSEAVFGSLAKHWHLGLGLTIIASVALLPKGLVGVPGQIRERRLELAIEQTVYYPPTPFAPECREAVRRQFELDNIRFNLDLGQDMPPILAQDKVHFVGQPIAFVVADTLWQAMDAAECVVVDYEPLPALVDMRAAVSQGAPQLHEAAPANTSVIFAAGDAQAVNDAMAKARHISRLTINSQRLVIFLRNACKSCHIENCCDSNAFPHINKGN